MTLPQDKAQLRKMARAQRQALPMAAWSEAMRDMLRKKSWFQAATHILSYYPLSDEPDWIPLAAQFPHQKWYLPRMAAGNTLAFYPYTGMNQLISGPFGVMEPPVTPEPFQPDDRLPGNHMPKTLLLVPALLMDHQGHRLGYGKGYYDRLLQGWQSREVFSIGLIPDALVCDALPCDPHDCPVSLIMTEAREYWIT